MRALPCLLLCAACGGSSARLDAASEPLGPTANPAREITGTRLAVDATALTATAAITFAPSALPGATLEVGDLAIAGVTLDAADLPFAVASARLDLALAAGTEPSTVEITYRWKHHEGFQGASATGYTLTWPYFCGNVFPCHSDPADGTTFELALAGVPAGKSAVFPAAIAAEAPAYQLAWSIDSYTELPLGTTTAGTQLSVWHRAGEAAKATQGSMYLVAAFDWFERTIGPYRFGPKAGSVSVAWAAGAFGGMEHHPFWHLGASAIGDVETHTHEAAHGWFGDGIRIRCWEDFVLSEGTVTYLAGRALDVVAPPIGANIWASYETGLGAINAADKVWPQSCGAVDVLKDRLFTRAPYMRGAFFYRAVALKVGADVLDGAIAAFYAAHATGAATMADMLDTINTVTGYDPTTCADMWLKSATKPAVGPCP